MTSPESLAREPPKDFLKAPPTSSARSQRNLVKYIVSTLGWSSNAPKSNTESADLGAAKSAASEPKDEVSTDFTQTEREVISKQQAFLLRWHRNAKKKARARGLRKSSEAEDAVPVASTARRRSSIHPAVAAAFAVKLRASGTIAADGADGTASEHLRTSAESLPADASCHDDEAYELTQPVAADMSFLRKSQDGKQLLRLQQPTDATSRHESDPEEEEEDQDGENDDAMTVRSCPTPPATRRAALPEPPALHRRDALSTLQGVSARLADHLPASPRTLGDLKAPRALGSLQHTFAEGPDVQSAVVAGERKSKVGRGTAAAFGKTRPVNNGFFLDDASRQLSPRVKPPPVASDAPPRSPRRRDASPTRPDPSAAAADCGLSSSAGSGHVPPLRPSGDAIYSNPASYLGSPPPPPLVAADPLPLRVRPVREKAQRPHSWGPDTIYSDPLAYLGLLDPAPAAPAPGADRAAAPVAEPTLLVTGAAARAERGRQLAQIGGSAAALVETARHDVSKLRQQEKAPGRAAPRPPAAAAPNNAGNNGTLSAVRNTVAAVDALSSSVQPSLRPLAPISGNISPRPSANGTSGASHFGIDKAQWVICAFCSMPIVTDIVTAGEKSYHVEHFKCANCRCLIGAGRFFEHDSMAYCDSCYVNLYCAKCHKCGEPIRQNEVTALGHTWHADTCFCCNHCGKPFAGGQFIERDGSAYDRDCFYELFAPKCGGCSKPIVGPMLSAMNKKWHKEHFCCSFSGCAKPLAGAVFYEVNLKPFCEVHRHPAVVVTPSS